jgi:replicative DNA helicase
VDATEHGRVILGAIIAYRSTEALDYALLRISSEQFTDPVQRALFILVQRYADSYRAILPRHALDDVVRGEAPGTAHLYQEYYDALAALEPGLADFQHSVDQLRALSYDRATKDAILRANTIITEGWWDEAVHAKLHGHAAARAYLLSALAVIERDSSVDGAAEGDMRKESEEILTLYSRAKLLREQGRAPGVEFGIDTLDRKLPGGCQPGELGLVLAWTTAGKTSWCVQHAWHAAVMQGRNVVIYTTETLRPQVRVKLLARHSRHPKFGLPEGINSRLIRAGAVRDDAAFKMVLKDLSESPEYGRLYVAQVPRGGTMSVIQGRHSAICRQFRPDIVFIDYLQLLHPDVVRKDAAGHEVAGNVVKAAKEFAIDAQVPVWSPWQVNREGRREVKTAGRYGLQHTAASAEAANTSDIVLSLVDPEQDDSAGVRVDIDVIVEKNRDGERGGKPIELTADFRTSTFIARSAVAAAGDLMEPP